MPRESDLHSPPLVHLCFCRRTVPALYIAPARGAVAAVAAVAVSRRCSSRSCGVPGAGRVDHLESDPILRLC